MGMTIFRPGQRLVIPSPGVQVWTQVVSAGGSVGALDGISNVAAAYSLRKLRSAYAGSAVRVRRSSDSTEQDIGFDGTGEFDTAAFSSFIGGGAGFVRTWYDQSVNGRNVTQTTTAAQPSIALSAINGKPALGFDGINDRLISPTAFTTINQPFTWLHVSKQNDTSNRVPVSSGASSPAIFWFNGTGSFNAGATLTKSATVTNANIFSAIASGSNSNIFVNGGTPTIGNAGGSGWGRLEFGNWNADVYWFSGYIAEFVALSVSVGSTDHNTIGSNMATRYGLSWSAIS